MSDRLERRRVLPGRAKEVGPGLPDQRRTRPLAAQRGLAWGGLANTYYWIEPKRGVAGAIITQTLPFADQPVLDLFENFERAIYAGRSG